MNFSRRRSKNRDGSRRIGERRSVDQRDHCMQAKFARRFVIVLLTSIVLIPLACAPEQQPVEPTGPVVEPVETTTVPLTPATSTPTTLAAATQMSTTTSTTSPAGSRPATIPATTLASTTRATTQELSANNNISISPGSTTTPASNPAGTPATQRGSIAATTTASASATESDAEMIRRAISDSGLTLPKPGQAEGSSHSPFKWIVSSLLFAGFIACIAIMVLRAMRTPRRVDIGRRPPPYVR
jgi:hypothetical protein